MDEKYEILIKEIKKKDERISQFLSAQFSPDVRILLSPEGESAIKEFFEKNNFKRVAIYGGGFVGKILYRYISLFLENILVIDRQSETPFFSKSTITSLDVVRMAEVDIIIITPIFYYDEIFADLTKRGFNNIITLPEIWVEINRKIDQGRKS
jgi:hypothetical protein